MATRFFHGFPEPDLPFTRTPNVFYDELVNTFDLPETRIVLLLIRSTYGWKYREVAMSLDEIAESIDYTRSSTAAALARLTKRGILLKALRTTKHGASTASAYRLRFSGESPAADSGEDNEKVGSEILDPGGVRDFGPPESEISDPHIGSKETSVKERNTPLPPFSEPESEPLPEPPPFGVDFEDVLILHRRAKGSKKPSAPDLRATTEWMAGLAAEPGEMYAAMQAFLDDDFWREQKYPIAAFRKHYSKYCQIAQERPAPPPASATIADLPIASQRRSQPTRPLVPGATPDDTDAFIAEWNAGPCEALRVRVVSIELRQALRSSLSNPKFRENWATLLQKAHTLRAQPGKEWLTLSLLLKGEKWARLLNGDYDWSPNAKPAPGAGTDALDRLIAASQQKANAKAKEKTDRADN